MKIIKEYPRIFTISTVGIKKHGNIDFLIHPLRTDFTGESESGKSLIAADLLQLIFVARKGEGFWKSTTEVLTNERRDVEGMVLDNLGYGFINVEVAKNKFIVIGVHIQKNAKTIYPFIIQKGLNWDTDQEKNLVPFENFLSAKELLHDNKILPIAELKEFIEDKKKYQLKHFHNKASDFHKILFNNELLQTDLSHNDTKVKSFAQILQSFARSGEIDTTPEKLLDFLFQNDTEIDLNYQKKKKEIEESQRVYNERLSISNRVKEKKLKLLNLLDFNKKRKNTYQKYLLYDVAYNLQQHEQAQIDLQNVIRDLAKVKLEIIFLNYKQNEINITTHQGEIADLVQKIGKVRSNIESQNEIKNNAVKNKEHYTKIEQQTKAAEDKIENQKNEIEKIESWLSVFQSIENLRNKFSEQAQVSRDKESLKNLKDHLVRNDLVASFENSLWASDFKKAMSDYEIETKALLEQIERLNDLKPLFDVKQKDSFAQWAIQNTGKLNIEQESVLMHFVNLSTKSPSQTTKGIRYIPKPESIFKNITSVKKEKSGFWIELNGIHEYVETIKKQLFDNPETLPGELKKFGENVNGNITRLQNELNALKTLHKSLFDDFHFHKGTTEIYLKRNELNNYKPFEPFNFIAEQELERIIKLYEADEKKIEDERIKSKYIQAKQKHDEAYAKWNSNNTSLESANTQINLLQSQEAEHSAKKLKEEELLNGFLQIKAKLETDEITWKAENHESHKPKDFKTLKFVIENEAATLKSFGELNSAINEKSIRFGQLIEKEKLLSENVPLFESKFKVAKINYEKELKIEFVNQKVDLKLTQNDLQTSKTNFDAADAKYTTEYENIVMDSTYSAEAKDERLINFKNHFDFKTLAQVFFPSIIRDIQKVEEKLAEDIELHLDSIASKIQEINVERYRRISSVFQDIRELAIQYRDTIEDLRDFFKDRKIAGAHYVHISSEWSTIYPIIWLDKLDKEIKNQAGNVGLFEELGKENADEIIIKTFRQFSNNKIGKIEIKKLLNPKSYIKLELKLKTPTGENAPGSNGQNYALLALICIGKLSIIEKDKEKGKKKFKKGIRYMAIDEVAGLGENFDMLKEVAQEFDYQIFTMTISPNDMDFKNGEQHTYFLRKNSIPEFHNRNPLPMATFSKYESEEYTDDLLTEKVNELANS